MTAGPKGRTPAGSIGRTILPGLRRPGGPIRPLADGDQKGAPQLGHFPASSG